MDDETSLRAQVVALFRRHPDGAYQVEQRRIDEIRARLIFVYLIVVFLSFWAWAIWYYQSPETRAAEGTDPGHQHARPSPLARYVSWY